MRKFAKNNILQKGSMMVEALAMLGLITMVTPILYKKAAERTTELQDINVATQLRMVSKAVDSYLADNYVSISEDHSGGADEFFELSDSEMAELENYMPHGFKYDQSKLFDDFKVGVRKQVVPDVNGNDHFIYTSAILAPLKNELSMMRSSKIASMVGAGGGVYRGGSLQGVQGTWTADLDANGYDFSDTGDLKEGSLAVISDEAISSVKGDVSSADVLYRVDTGDIDKNTMQTTLYMGGNDVDEVAKLIAQSDKITIGNDENDGGLLVNGATELANTLNVTGAATLEDTLDVTGATELASTLDVTGATTLNDALTVGGLSTLKKGADVSDHLDVVGKMSQSGGDAKFNPKSMFDVYVNAGGAIANIRSDDENITLTQGKGIDIRAEKGSVGLIGNDTEIIGVNGVTISGKGDNGVTINAPDTKVLLNTKLTDMAGDARVRRNLTVDGTFTADKVHGKTSISGGGTTPENANFYADANKVEIDKNNFRVGSSDNYRILANAGNVTMKVGTQAGKMSGLSIDIFSMEGVSGNSNLVMSTGVAGLTTGGPDGTIPPLNGFGAKNRFLLYQRNALISAENDIQLKSFNNGDIAMVAGNVQLDANGLALAKSGSTISSGAVGDGAIGTSALPPGAAVAISRDGILEVRAPTKDVNGGFIRARRLVSDVPYPSGDAFQGYDKDGLAPGKKYDYYQVNPAYTSVMNDIKLASRGGARLSDILPDFINKGIYVVDNTYQDASVGNSWPTISGGKPSTEPASCDTTACIASPWLGFVPAPQCPKNYAKGITITPFRWRMSEVFAVYNLPSPSTGYGDIISGKGNTTGKKFREYFFRYTDPQEAMFELSTNSSDSHTHVPESGYPMTFQTNTWLNTTMEAVGTNITDLQGWHAIMGFVYRPLEYEDLLNDLSSQPIKEEDVYWNVFPVYAQEMAGVASVYCIFDRYRLDGGTRTWVWGSDTPVYQYDQLNNFQSGYTKSGMNDDLNDPQLGYDDVW